MIIEVAGEVFTYLCFYYPDDMLKCLKNVPSEYIFTTIVNLI